MSNDQEGTTSKGVINIESSDAETDQDEQPINVGKRPIITADKESKNGPSRKHDQPIAFCSVLKKYDFLYVGEIPKSYKTNFIDLETFSTLF